MRTPATFGRFLTKCAVALGIVQVCLLGLVALYFGLLRALSVGRGYSMAIPVWYGWLSLGLSSAAVLWLWVRYRRGGLDVYEIRRSRRYPAEG